MLAEEVEELALQANLQAAEVRCAVASRHCRRRSFAPMMLGAVW